MDQSKIQRLLNSSKQVILLKSILGPSEDLLTYSARSVSSNHVLFLGKLFISEELQQRRAVVKAGLIILVYSNISSSVEFSINNENLQIIIC